MGGSINLNLMGAMAGARARAKAQGAIIFFVGGTC